MEKGLSAKFQLEISQNKIRNSRRRQSRTPSSYSKPYLEGQVNQLYKQINSQFNTGYFVNSDDIEQEISKAGFKNLSRFRLKLIIKRMAPSSKVFPQCLKTYDQFI